MNQELSELLKQAIEAARGGNKVQARDMLLQVVDIDPHNEVAWMWLSGLVDGIEDRIIACENVLTINPSNDKVRAYLSELRRKQAALDSARAQEQIEETFHQAKLFKAMGDGEGALRFVHKVLEQNNHHEGAWFLMADLSSDLNERAHALEMVLEINPANTEARHDLGEARHFRANPLDYAAQLEEEGRFKEAIELYKQLAAGTKNPREFDRIYSRITRLEGLQEEKIEYVNPSSSIMRLSFTWPLLYLILILVQMGLNPFAHPAFLLCLGLPVVALGSFLLALAEVRSHHTIWKKVFSEQGGGGSATSRMIASITGWLLILIPHLVLLLDAFNRLRNFKIPPEPF